MAVPADVKAYVAEHGLTERSSWRATGRTVVVAGLYAGLSLLGLRLEHPLVWVAVWLVQGLALAGAYSAMHEAGHATLYRSRRVNRFAGPAWASVILVNWSLWRSFHLEHHAHTGGPDDPESAYKIDIVRWRQYLLLPLGGLQFILQLWFDSLGTLVGRFPGYVRTRDAGARRSMRVDALVLLTVTAAAVAFVVAAPGLGLRLWLGPFLAGTCLALPFTALNEHYGCAPAGSPFETTRTVVSNRFVRFLLWNGNYHVGHHLLATVPFHHAPQLHAYLAPRTTHLAASYTGFHLGVLRGCRSSGPGGEGAEHRFGGGPELAGPADRCRAGEVRLDPVRPPVEGGDDHVLAAHAHGGDVAHREVG